jgi:hypothetical protein
VASQETTFEQLTCKDRFLHHFGPHADHLFQDGSFIGTIRGSVSVQNFLEKLDKTYPNYIEKMRFKDGII